MYCCISGVYVHAEIKEQTPMLPPIGLSTFDLVNWRERGGKK
ncbi:hypothetical protein E2C01_072790 [Portunus trituberculatus]|uniref:Uncharacterized protein n=1 Tax=Portunus trituberculatus TaxID=210409 RepID=A0A5B7I8T7_PORTR|nr:hypothetical protein [Portunus trituberculatus]